MTKQNKLKLEEIFALKINNRVIFGVYRKEVMVAKIKIVLNKGIDEI